MPVLVSGAGGILFGVSAGGCLKGTYRHGPCRFFPDGRTFASASDGETLKIWDIAFNIYIVYITYSDIYIYYIIYTF